jgi:hypothetical protein
VAIGEDGIAECLIVDVIRGAVDARNGVRRPVVAGACGARTRLIDAARGHADPG